MFKGTIKYKLQERQLEIPYEVYGYDTSTTCSLMLHGNGNTARKFMITSDLDEQLNDDLLDDLPKDRRVNIDMAKVTVSTGKHKENEKMVKNKVNTLFFCQLAAVIRYAKSHCTKKNEKGYTGISLASKEFETRVETEYEIKYETEDKLLACLKLRLGCIVSLRIESPTLSITLEQDDSIADCLPKMVDGWTTGLKFNEDYLGFPLKEVEMVEVTGIDGMYTCIEDIVKAHPDKEFSWLLQKDYRIVDDEHLEEICDYIMNWDGYVYYDTETTGLNINFMSRVGQADQLVGVVLSVKYGESFYFPLQMKSIKNLCNGDHWYVMEHYLRPILEGKELVAHNMSYDWKVGYIYDINCNIVHDTMALIKLTIGAEQLDYPMGLKENAKLLLGRDSLELSDLLVDNEWGDSDIKFWDLPYELVRLYACADTDNTNGLLQYAIQADLLTKYNAKKVYEIEIAFSYAVAYQEFYGHRIDVTNLSKVREQIGKEQEEYMGKMEEIVGHKFNPNSSPQLQQIMYSELGIPEQISRKTGRPTTDKETLKKLAELTDENDNPIYPFCCYLQKFREAEGVRKIVDKFPEHATKDGFIFSRVMQYGTTTGRVSINNPNYQSYNDPIKKNVVPRPGYWMFDTDYSSVEYRVLGNMVGNKRIMENFKDPDFDYHAYQAARMYGVPYSAVTKKMRKSAKGINFGLPYGMGDESLGVRIFGEPSEENTRKAAALRAAYFKGQEDIRDWFEYHRNRGVKEGFTETYFGRRRYYHKGKFTVGAIRRQAGNQVIQGTAADIYKTAVGRVFKRICREGWLGKVLFTGFIHDELLGECSNDINPAVFLKVLREEFEVKITNEDGTPWCPLYMGFGYGMSWYEAKSVELPIKLQWEIVDNYGENGFPYWTGDGRAFCDTVPDMLRDFSVRDIRNQLLDENSQGKEIKPTLNNELIDCIKEDSELYTKGISEYCEKNSLKIEDISKNKQKIEEYLDKTYHIQNVLFDKDGNVVLEFKGSKETQECIDLFCRLHNVERAKINILNIAEVQAKEQTSEDSLILTFEEDDQSDYERKILGIQHQVNLVGLSLDVDDGKIYIKHVPQPAWGIISSYAKNEPSETEKAYKVIVVQPELDFKMTEVSAWINSTDITNLSQLYLTLANK